MEKKSICLVVDGLFLANGKASQTRLLANKFFQAGIRVGIINISPFLKPGSSYAPECRLEKSFSLPKEIEITEIVSYNQLIKQFWLTRKKYKTVCFVGNYFIKPLKYFIFLKMLGKKTVILFSSRYQPEGKIPWYRKRWLMVDRLIAVSRSLENDLLENSSPRAFRHKAATILNRIDPATFREVTPEEKRALRKRLGLEQTERIVIFVGGIGHAKGIDLLFDAWRLVRRQVPEARLLLVGPICSLCGGNADYPGITHEGEKMLAEKMEIFNSRLAGLVRDHEKISYLGVKPNVSDYLAAADIFIFPSRTEVSPNAPMEAMAAGLPVVAFDNQEIIGEIVSHGQQGILVPYEDFAALAEATVNLLEDERKRLRLGSNARKRFREDLVFDDRQTMRFLEVFNQI